MPRCNLDGDGFPRSRKLPPRHRCPFFLGGVALGLLLGASCMAYGLRTVSVEPASPVPTVFPGN